MRRKPKEVLFKRLNVLTIGAVYFLILVGGIVRSTGSGMGCPDWPKCFGSYVPPLSSEELPANYKEIYKNKRLQKNERLAGVLSGLGLKNLASEVLNGKDVKQEHEFNVQKTWIEYVNRLVGVLIGLLIMACAVVGYSYLQVDPKIFWQSVAAVILVSFQGWVGSLVVSTNLLPGMITFHMVLAILLVALLIYIGFTANNSKIEGLVTYKAYKLRRLLLICMLLFFTQVLLGTQIREAIDMISIRLGEALRTQWIDELGLIFYVHRSYSLLLLALHLYLVYRIYKSVENFKATKVLVWGLLGLLFLEILTGVVLAYFALPYFLQPVHLLLALMIFGIQYFLYLLVSSKSSNNLNLSNG